MTYVTLTPNVHTYDGNTLNINQLAETQSISTIANFENINIVLGAENTAEQLETTALIDLSGTLYLGNGYATEEATATASEAGDTQATTATKYANFGLYTSLDSTLATGDTVTLFTAKDIDGNFANLGEDNSGSYTGSYGTLLAKTWDILTVGNDDDGYTMTATLKSTQAGEQSKVLGEASVSSVAALSAGADLLTGPAMASAQARVEAQSSSKSSAEASGGNSSLSSGPSAAPFAVSSVGQSRYHTGSHVDTESFSVNAGVAYGGQGTDGDWLSGIFVEYSRGEYTTYNSFSTGSVEGEGTSNAFGLGGFARYDFNGNSSKYKDFNPYVEGSVRLGYVEADYASDGGDGAGIPMEFDVRHMYMGAHLGLGSVSQLTDKVSLDLSLRYFWTHQMGGNENIAGHNVDFHAVDSHRVRLGARTDYALMDDQESGRFTLYSGVAMEQEFDGTAKSSVDGYEAPAPSLQGTTVLGELGFTYTPLNVFPMTIDLGFQGYTGKREGVSGSLQLIYAF
ncbi:MAG: hypothetical protein R3Y11_02975 [Pseudomonadota bacterium]